MADEKTELAVIDGETLMDMKLPPTKFCVDTLLPQGLCLIVSLFGFFAFFIFFFVKIPLSKQNHGPHHQCQKSHDSRRSIHQAVDTADVLRFNRVYLITDIWLRN